MKLVITLVYLFILTACGSSDDSSTKPISSDDSSTKPISSDDSSTKPISSDDSLLTIKEDNTSGYKYNITCKCKGLESEPLTTSSDIGVAHAQLLAGAICVVAQPEKEILLKKEKMSAAEKVKIQSIFARTILEALENNPDESVLNSIYDCVPN